jgi:hypothetical protein
VSKAKVYSRSVSALSLPPLLHKMSSGQIQVVQLQTLEASSTFSAAFSDPTNRGLGSWSIKPDGRSRAASGGCAVLPLLR